MVKNGGAIKLKYIINKITTCQNIKIPMVKKSPNLNLWLLGNLGGMLWFDTT